MKILKAVLTFIFILGIGYAIYIFLIFPLFFHYVKIIHVEDADTFLISDNGKIKQIQLIGVDAPEYNQENNLHQCFEKEATTLALQKYFSKDQEVQLISDKALGDKDPYGRFLRYVFLKNGDLLNEKLISDGIARQFLMPYEKYEYQDQMEKAQFIAKQKQIGIWNPQGCDGKF